MSYCEDCGCKVYNGFCTNCHEEVYIEEQYYDIGEPVPELISEMANNHREVAKNKVNLNKYK